MTAMAWPVSPLSRSEIENHRGVSSCFHRYILFRFCRSRSEPRRSDSAERATFRDLFIFNDSFFSWECSGWNTTRVALQARVESRRAFQFRVRHRFSHTCVWDTARKKKQMNKTDMCDAMSGALNARALSSPRNLTFGVKQKAPQHSQRVCKWVNDTKTSLSIYNKRARQT